MGLVGVQSLTILLAITLVICTGVIIGSITISTGTDLTQKARETGDAGVATCLESGDRDIKVVAARLLKSVVLGVAVSIDAFLDVPSNAVRRLASLAQAHHPNVSTSPAFIGGEMRRNLRTSYDLLSDENGIDMLAYETLPWAPNHPVFWRPDNDAAPAASWGGLVSFMNIDETSGTLPTDGTRVRAVLESRNMTTHTLAASNYLVFGEPTALGDFMVQPPAPTHCKGQGVRFDKGETVGYCAVPSKYIITGSSLESSRRRWKNLWTDGPMNPSNEVVFTPLMTVLSRTMFVVTYSFTHPEMLNMNAKQADLVGFAYATVQVESMRKMFNSQKVPEGSHLYAIEENQWLGQLGGILAYNKGRSVDIRMQPMPGQFHANGSAVIYPYAFMLNIVNHTMVQNDSGDQPPSVIAQHGRYIMSELPNKYQSAVERSEASFVEWKSSAPAETYWTVVHLLQRGDMKWYISLLVPRASVMGKIDESTTLIRLKNEHDKKESDDKMHNSLVMMLCVVFSSVFVLLALAVVLVRFIVAPLHRLAEDMASVAVMRLEEVDLSQASSLSEVAAMQASFVQMVRNLSEYRDYMPASVLVTQGGDEDTHTETDATSMLESMSEFDRTTQGRSRSTHSASRSSVSRMVTKREALKDLEGLRRRHISCAYYNVRDWHGITQGMDSAEIISLHSKLVSTIIARLHLNKAVCEVFSGDRVLATFNAFVTLSTHKVEAVRCSMAVTELVTALSASGSHKPLDLSWACVSGESKVGSLGCAGMKKMTVLSPQVSWLLALERYNRKRSQRGMVDHFLAKDVQAMFVLKCTDAAAFPKRTARTDIKVFEVAEAMSVTDEEWMYQLETAVSSSPFVCWNRIFDLVFKKSFDEARATFASLDPHIDPVCEERAHTCLHPHPHPHPHRCTPAWKQSFCLAPTPRPHLTFIRRFTSLLLSPSTRNFHHGGRKERGREPFCRRTMAPSNTLRRQSVSDERNERNETPLWPLYFTVWLNAARRQRTSETCAGLFLVLSCRFPPLTRQSQDSVPCLVEFLACRRLKSN